MNFNIRNIRNDKEYYEMKKTYLAKLAIVSFTVVAAFAFMGTAAQAETGTISATVSIATPIVITGDSALAFGVFTAPSSGSQTWTIAASNGALSTGGGDGVDLFNDDHSRGVFTIDGENDATVTYSVAITNNFGGAGTTLSALTVNPSSTSVLSSSGSLTVGVGGTVTLTDAAADGSPALITLTANY